MTVVRGELLEHETVTISSIRCEEELGGAKCDYIALREFEYAHLRLTKQGDNLGH